jgi:CTP:molybdopterin cytidylyltransferase MocA
MRTVAALLAAGGGSRFHGPTHKLLADLDGRPVIAHAVANALDADIGPLVVVTGAADVRDALTCPGVEVSIIHNERWADGQAGSIALAVAEADRQDAEFLLIGLADQPFVAAEAWRLVASAADEWPVVTASYDGRRGPHPVRLHRSIWPLLPTSGDDGARSLLRELGGSVHDVACPGSAADIDTLEDVQRWRSS